MGTVIDRQIEGYMILKKMGVDRNEHLTLTMQRSGSYDAKLVINALKTTQEKHSKPTIVMRAEQSAKARGHHDPGHSADANFERSLAENSSEEEEGDGSFYPDEVEKDTLEEDEATEILLAITSGRDAEESPRLEGGTRGVPHR